MRREFGYSLKGTRIVDQKSGKKAKRISVIAGLVNRKTLIAPAYFNCYTDSAVFNIWLKQVLLPELKPGYTIVMDNASFHKSAKTKELIESVKCNLLYLPAYSPDLNPIEKKWSHIKKFIKKIRNKFENFTDALDYVLCHNHQ